MASETMMIVDPVVGDAKQSVKFNPFADAPTPLRARASRVHTEETLCIRCGLHPTNKRKALQLRSLCCNKCPNHGPWCTMNEDAETKQSDVGATENGIDKAPSKGPGRPRKKQVVDDDDDDDDEQPVGRRSLVEVALQRTEQAYNKKIEMEHKQREKRMRDDEKELAAIEKRFRRRHSTLLSAVRSTGSTAASAVETAAVIPLWGVALRSEPGPEAAVEMEAVPEAQGSCSATEPISQSPSHEEPLLADSGIADASAPPTEARRNSIDEILQKLEDTHATLMELEPDSERHEKLQNDQDEAATSQQKLEEDEKHEEEVACQIVCSEEYLSVAEVAAEIDMDMDGASDAAVKAMSCDAPVVNAKATRSSLKTKTSGRRSSIKEVLQQLKRVHNDMEDEDDQIDDVAVEDEFELLDHESFMNQVKVWLFEEDGAENPDTSAEAVETENESSTAERSTLQESQAERSGGCEAALQKVKMLYNKLVEWNHSKKPEEVVEWNHNKKPEEVVEAPYPECEASEDLI